jgi:murein hydrolase activator
MLSARYAAGAPDAMRIALSGDDPAGVARQLHYAGHVARAAAQLIASYREEIAQARRMAREADEHRQRIAAVERATQADRDRIQAERRERQQVLARVAAEIRSGRKQIGQLRADEARLARLVEQLGRALGRVESVPQPDGTRQAFSALRGRLRLPVAGELTARFGAPRGAAGTESKGVFIRAPEGRPVRAVAGGRVVFADWMRGFGNILIVDHGEAYLSIYANNESLLKQVGDAVNPGDPVATTGASGGNEETGLYFELRHLGKAFDPLRWARLR